MTGTTPSTPEPGAASAPPRVESSPARQWLALTQFLLGVLVGVIAFALYTRLGTTQLAAAPDAMALRAAARSGTLDAIATLQAGGSPVESSATSTPVVVETAFAVRPANQVGDKDAAVTIVEFSDFQ